MRLPALALIALAVTAGSAGARAEEPVSADLPVSLERPGRPLRRGFVRTGVQIRGDGPSTIATSASAWASAWASAPAPVHRLLYLNRNGGEYTGGNDDSTINRSSVIAFYRTSGGTLSPFPYGDDLWDAVVGCVRERYAPFGVTITDADPGDAAHLEIAVAGKPEEIGLPTGCCLGVAPFACEPIENAVSYAFAGVHPESVEDMCWTILQESAHTLGLDHELLCQDPMTYLAECGSQKVFSDEDAPCGEDAARDCMCTGESHQNSVARLRAVVGEAHDEVDVFAPAIEDAYGGRDGGGFGCGAVPGRDALAGTAALLLALAAWFARRTLTAGRPRRLPWRTSRSAGRASRSRPR